MNMIPEWAWEFHGHRCPFMPLGYRMGKLAAVFYSTQYLGKGAIRLYVTNEFQDEFGQLEFFIYRRKKFEPSAIPARVAKEAIDWMYTQPDKKYFKSI